MSATLICGTWPFPRDLGTCEEPVSLAVALRSLLACMTDLSLDALRVFRFRPSDRRLACQDASKVIAPSRRLLHAAFRCPAGLTGAQVQRAARAAKCVATDTFWTLWWLCLSLR